MQTATTTKFYESGFPKSIHRHKLNVPVNERLRFARENKKYTLAKATKELNKLGIACALSTLQSYEAAEDSLNRRFPSLKMLISLSDLYECSTDFLLGISDEPNRYTPDLLSQIENNQKLSWRDKSIDKHQQAMIVYKIEQIMDL
jgi:transcriptional regulator with XRE-family HTH domain